ncbi:hypothetical protein CH373_16010 [Leptospira perolatii]|uniref:Uncharacterized protein n=1 Tax=Leptospira perolatii TaxID=2023191 RepID=A0A2M9ZJ59_9LEPT|nr:hypothetical protein [Leptospira perolatii]PJZ68402.1 hypothetical protein CH360_16210 [Leptospira perolatii]PJZ72100.1 hypothetical protein CH373_16010 [Leptospira perolatii]
MKSKFVFCLAILAISGLVHAQDQQTKGQKREDLQAGTAILETEKGLDERVFELNQRLTRHTVLMKMKVRILPFRTVLFKGKGTADECVAAVNQEDPANNCIRVEVYDFIRDEERGQGRLVQGGLAKYMELYFEGANSNDPDPRMEPPRNISKIISRVYKNNYMIEDKAVSDVIDRGPNSQPAHNDKIELYYQRNGYPEFGRSETPGEKGVGKYILASMENTKTHTTRNQFKKNFYIKHLDAFDRLFTKIFDYNDQLGNDNYKENVEVLKESLHY